ncbi:MAG: hypothetical protein LBS54_08690 [Dysgonamonadaceae bacterium]|jgi:hypothetical protein|nr:hypothetical protein [Dysgonamonadaceae bacterium]
MNKIIKFKLLFSLLMLLLLPLSRMEAQTPGGVNNPNYQWAVWLTPDKYTQATGIWENRITGGYSVGNFNQVGLTNSPVHPTRSTTVPGYNFHPVVSFSQQGTSTVGKQFIVSENKSYSVTANNNITTIFVLNRKPRPNQTSFDTYDFLMSFKSTGTNADNTIAWYGTGENIDLWANNQAGGIFRSGILAVDNANDGTTALEVYKNGHKFNPTTSSLKTTITASNGLGLAGRFEGTTGGYGYDGDIQEVIVLKNTANRHLNPGDMQKIHSYLSIKYGLPLNNTDNYVNSSGATVWQYDAQYHTAVFGLAHDEASALYQKQSKNLGDNITVYIDNIATFNDGNNGTIDDGVYLLFGATDTDLNSIVKYVDPVPAITVTPPKVALRSKTSLKVQLTGQATFDVNFKLGSTTKYQYMLVSSSPDFDSNNTTAHPVTNLTEQTFININIKDGDYIAFACEGPDPGGAPGGVAEGLRMWLRADDDTPGAIDTVPNQTLTWDNGATVDTYEGTTIAWKNLNNPTGNVQTVVTKWSDPVRNIVYNDQPVVTRRKPPVYLKRHYLMNYYPAVDFYNNGDLGGTNDNDMSAFLSTTKGPMTVGKPANSTIFAVINGSVRNSSSYPNIYFISWHKDATMDSYTEYMPGYGFQAHVVGSEKMGRPRLRLAPPTNIDNKVFSPGETTIASYQLTNVPAGSISAGNIRVGFNMMEDVNTGTETTSDDWYMNANGSLGGSLYHTRSLRGLISEVIAYERALNNDEKALVNSYYALKYGLTLTPSALNYTVPRFDYKFSDNTALWLGHSSISVSDYVTFYNNLAAIIRDDDALLHNRQAHSTDIGSLVHLGVAGTCTAYDGDPSGLGDFEYDKEAVMVGNNTVTGVKSDVNAAICGPECVFRRTWMVHKQTYEDRPIPVIVSAQNNGSNNLGDDNISDYYNVLNPAYKIYMIVAESKEALNPDSPDYGNDITAVIPMTWLNGEHQCIYTFSKENTYITFGYKPETMGCPPETPFRDTKTYSWQNWTKQNYGTGSPTIDKSEYIDLGNDVKIINTKVTYDSPVKTSSNYPHVENGRLRISRSGGNASGVGNLPGNRVTIEIEVNTSTLVDFQISGLDGSSRSYAAVQVTGYCGANAVAPELSYAGKHESASYKIIGNSAIVQKNQSNGATSANGTVNVKFLNGVKKIVIVYYMAGRVTSSRRWLYIGPIRLRAVPPPAVVNEDGLSFVKDVEEYEITTCKPVKYVFYIGNTNCNQKYVNFTDELPEGLTWKVNGVGLDAANVDNTSLKINDYEGTNTLQIDSLIVPGESVLVFTATAVIDPNIGEYTGWREWGNKAKIDYIQVIEDEDFPRELWSMDRYTHDEYTYFRAKWEERDETIELVAVPHPIKYGHNSSIRVTLTVNNPNAEDIQETFLNLSWNEEFSFDETTLAITGAGTTAIVDYEAGSHSILIAKDDDGEGGFTIPGNNTPVVITFILTAPDKTGLVEEWDEVNDECVEMVNGDCKIRDLQVGYEFWSEGGDECVIESMIDLDGEVKVPHRIPKTSIIINKHISNGVY